MILIAFGYSIYFIWKGSNAIKSSHRIEKERRLKERLARERAEKEEEERKKERREKRLKDLGATIVRGESNLALRRRLVKMSMGARLIDDYHGSSSEEDTQYVPTPTATQYTESSNKNIEMADISVKKGNDTERYLISTEPMPSERIVAFTEERVPADTHDDLSLQIKNQSMYESKVTD